MISILLAGFGGQGILFAGKFLANVGLLQGKQVSWLPSYGPEMRGGTANCSVILSEDRIGSPIVSAPDLLMCMNLPSMDKYEETVAQGGMLFYDSALIDRAAVRTDIRSWAMPATRIASERGIAGLANMILLGQLLSRASICDLDMATQVLQTIIPERKRALLDANIAAIAMGYNEEEG